MITKYTQKEKMQHSTTPHHATEVYGLSTDEKPLDMQNGDVFIEMDTGDIYFFDADSETWLNPYAEE